VNIHTFSSVTFFKNTAPLWVWWGGVLDVDDTVQ